jgi:tRNA modification GTPase
MDRTETICALSTPPGRAAIALVRISGPATFGILDQFFRAEKRPVSLERRAVLGRVIDRGGSDIDEALVTCFPSPHSYTGEDLAEISVHGSPVIVSAVIDLLCSGGARLAIPGEFTMRAFLNGRLDLAQAEAVNDVIHAATLYQARMAARQRTGELSRQLQRVKAMLLDVVVNLESAVEFVEEALPVKSRETVSGILIEAGRELQHWIQTYRRGRIVHDGFSLAVVGRPNVGKSSVFNMLLESDRSIVADSPGTTRDVVAEVANIEGIPVRLADTAGVRAAEDIVEQMGVARSFRAIGDADAVLLVVDLGRPPSADDEVLRDRLADGGCIVVMNKSDLPCCWLTADKERFAGDRARVEVSAKFGTGLPELRAAMLSQVLGGEGMDGLLVTNLRHCQCLEAAAVKIEDAGRALRDGLSEEFVLVDLHAAVRKLGEVTGETTVEDLLGEIFSRFCIGK